MAAQKVELEDILKHTGGCGRFQICLSLIVHSMKCVVCFTMIAMVFCAAVPDWWCMDDFIGLNNSDIIGNKNISQFKSCSSGNGSKTCSTFLFDGTIRTVVTEWDLFCENAWVPQTITSIQMAGVLFGNLLAGQIADLIGRKSPLFLSQASLVILNILAAFSTGWVMFSVLRFFLGFAVGVFITIMYNIQAEFALARWRTWIVHVPSWPICLALFGLVAWLIKDWQYIHIATACVGTPLLFTWWFSLGLMGYGIQFGIQKLSGDLYLNIFLIGIIWAPLQFVNIYLCNRLRRKMTALRGVFEKLGRKLTALLFFGTSSVGAILVGVLQYIELNEGTKGLLINIFAITSLLLIYAGWSPIQTLTIELYPTVVRNIGYGLQNTMSRIGAIVGPQLVTLDSLIPGSMYFISAACGLISIVFMYPLTETKDAVLEDIIIKWTRNEHLDRVA